MKIHAVSLLAALTPVALCAALLAGCGDRDAPGHDDHQDHDDRNGHDDRKGHDDRREGDEHEEPDHRIVELTPEAATRANIETALVERRVLAGEIETTGEVGFDEVRLAHVSPLLAGRVQQVRAQLGDRVKVGQAVAVINSIEFGKAKASYLQAKAKFQLSSQTYEREKALAESKISSEQDMLTARAAYLEARAILQTSTQTLRLFGMSRKSIDQIAFDDAGSALFWIRAPLGGKIVDKHVAMGELVTPESKLFTVADLSRVWIWIDVYERDLRNVHLGDVAYVRADAYPDRVLEGKLRYLRDQVDVTTRTVRARIDVDNDDGLLRPGMFVRVRLSDPHANDPETLIDQVVAVPGSAVQREGDDKTIVFVQQGDHRYERREVKVGRRSGRWIQVMHGVKPEERVVTNGVFLLESEASRDALGGGHSH